MHTLDRLKETADALNEIAAARASNAASDMELVRRSLDATKESTWNATRVSHQLHKALANTSTELLIGLKTNDTNVTLHTYDAPDPMSFASRLFHNG
jgi:hypothetical protein